MNRIIAPSVLAADFLQLGNAIEMLNESQAEWVHIDVMDGHFVPNLSFGLPIIKAINSATDKFLDVHLMISNPQLYIKDYAAAGAQNLTVHYEVCDHLHRIIQAIKAEGMQAGVALNPHTPVQVLKDILHDLDLVCIMSVNPGFGGQSFIEHTYSKVSELHELKAKTNSTAKVQIDGGVSIANARQLVDAGAQVLVAGSAVFKAERPIQMIEKLMHV